MSSGNGDLEYSKNNGTKASHYSEIDQLYLTDAMKNWIRAQKNRIDWK